MTDRSKVTVTAEVHWETPRHPSVERKQRTPVQMIQTQGRFLMQVADIPVSVEVISPNAKQALVSNVTSGIIAIIAIIAPIPKATKGQQVDKQVDQQVEQVDQQVDQEVNKQVHPRNKDKD